MTEEQQLQKGFNAGYQLEKHDAKLSQTIQEGFADKNHPYAKGFVAGSQEFSNERSKTNNSALSKYMNPPEQDNTKDSNQKDHDRER